MRTLFVVVFLLFFFFGLSQKYSSTFNIPGIPDKEVYLASFYGEKNSLIDTVVPDKNGTIVFDMKPDYYTGMYRIFLEKETYIDFIYNQEDIEITSDMDYLYDSLTVIKSTENMLYFDFLRALNQYRLKFELMAPLNDYYPRSDTFFHDLRAKYIGVQADVQIHINEMLAQYPDAWASKIIALKRPLFYDPSLDEFGRREYTVEHYFDNIKFTDVELIRSNVYTNIAIEYISLFSNPNLTQDKLEEEFIKAVDKIMFEAMDNSILYEFIVDYLVGGFERFHFDKVLDYIAETYSPEQCENEERKTDLQTRLEKYAELSTGKKAPDFTISEMDSTEISLENINADYTLVLFWASWCPHCAESLPDIHNVYTNTDRTTLEILAVSLDSDREEWTTAVDQLNFTWRNCSDLKGWDSEVAIDYNVYATPTMFFLDKEKNILAKPITYIELETALKKEKIIE